MAPDEIALITDGRYVTEVEAHVAPGCPGLRLVTVDPTYDATLAALLRQADGLRVGFESAHLTVKRFDGLTAALRDTPSRRAAELVPAERIVEAARVRKDAAELETFRRAGALIGAVARQVLGGVREGQREWEVAADIDDRIRRGGFERPAFDTIVASGPNGALPHARPGDRRLQAGDLVVLDFGGVYDGYCVDITRTVSVGAPGAEARRVHDAVAAAQLAAVAAVRPSGGRDRRRRGGQGRARGARPRPRLQSRDRPRARARDSRGAESGAEAVRHSRGAAGRAR